MTIVVTGATGQLGRLAIASLIAKGVPASDIVGVGRQVEKLADLGVTAKQASYDDVESLTAAFAGADKLLFISGSEVGQRVPQHQNVADAAKAAGVGHIIYTSAPQLDGHAPLIAQEHRATEEILAGSGLPVTVLRNGWYVENYDVQQAIATGSMIGASGDGKLSLATRADLAEAAAAVVVGSGYEGKTYTLGGEPYTKGELAAEMARQSGKPVTYTDLAPEKFAETLVGFGLPQGFAEVLADADAAAQHGFLEVPGNDLADLLGRPVTPVAEAVRAAL